MKSILLFAVALCFAMAPAYSANISSAGLDGSDGGLLKVDQSDPYWWFCVQPDGSEGPLAAGPPGYEANVISLEYGWTRQTTERFSFAGAATEAARDDLALQVNVIEYVLDTYLPWNETADRFLENVGNPVGSTDQAADTNFFNSFYAIQQYVKRLHAKLYQDNVSFTDLSVYMPTSDIPNDPATATAAEIARNKIFDRIVAEVNGLGSAFFVSYDPLHDYAIVNTFQDQADPLDYQDAIIIGAVPEPSAGLLALGSVLFLAKRRRRA